METRSRNAPIFNREEDRISMLPETLIHHILSFLDMTYAVRTCVLSRRWRYIWTSLPTLSFNSKLYYSSKPDNYSDFIDFVDKVLFLRDGSNIQRFSLDWQDTLYLSTWQSEGAGEDINSRVSNTWMLVAVRRDVREVCIKGYSEGVLEIPICLGTSKSLTHLDLHMTGDCAIGLPSSMSLPRLKYLRLKSLEFLDEKLTNMFFSSCPALESLIIISCDILVPNLIISSLKLKHFEFHVYDGTGCEGIHNKVKLYAPNLTFFSWTDDLSTDYSLENLRSLVTAHIDMSPPEYRLDGEEKELYASSVMIYLRALHNVKVLTLSPKFVEVVSGTPEILDNQPPEQFSNLQRLKLRTWFSRDCIKAMIYLLKISPNIVSFSLERERNYQCKSTIYPFCDEVKFNTENGENYWDTVLSFPCMLYHLKLVEIHGIVGCINELKFLEILLKNSVVLEKVILFSSKRDSRHRKRMKKFTYKLLSFPRASPSVKFMFRF